MADNLHSLLTKCTARVICPESSGTGFFVAPATVVTAAHNLEDDKGKITSSVTIVWNGKKYRAKVLKLGKSVDCDLALLHVPIRGHSCVYLWDGVEPGDEVYTWGYTLTRPDGDSATFEVEGPVGRNGSMVKLKQGQAIKGFSGAPVLNLRTGGVCGVMESSRDIFTDLGGGCISTATVLSAFPEIVKPQREFHRKKAVWFDAVSTREMLLFNVREYAHSLSEFCLLHAHKALAPPGQLNAIQILAPITLERIDPKRKDKRDMGIGLTFSVNEFMNECGAARRGALVIGSAGAGKSSLLRLIAHKEATEAMSIADFSTLPILLRAGDLAPLGGEPYTRIARAALKLLSRDDHAGQVRALSSMLASKVCRVVVLVDALDEVENDDEIMALVQSAHGLFSWFASLTLVITTRQDMVNDFGTKYFDSYCVRQLEKKAIETLASTWLREGASQFLRQSDHLIESGILAIPLTLAIALKLGIHEEATQTSTADLYAKMAMECKAAWGRGDTAKRYGTEIAEHSLDIIAFIALANIQRPEPISQENLVKLAGEFLSTRYSQLHSNDIARRFADFANGDAIFLLRNREKYEWLHLTFRDYFAAMHLLESCRLNSIVSPDWLSLWIDKLHARVASFTIQLAPTQPLRDKLFATVLESSEPEKFRFLASVIKENAQISREVRKSFFDQLRMKVQEEAFTFVFCDAIYRNDISYFFLLRTLRDSPDGQTAFDGILEAPGWSKDARKWFKQHS